MTVHESLICRSLPVALVRIEIAEVHAAMVVAIVHLHGRAVPLGMDDDVGETWMAGALILGQYLPDRVRGGTNATDKTRKCFCGFAPWSRPHTRTLAREGCLASETVSIPESQSLHSSICSCVVLTQIAEVLCRVVVQMGVPLE